MNKEDHSKYDTSLDTGYGSKRDHDRIFNNILVAMILLLIVAIVLSLSSCGVVYRGKYGTYTTTSTGTIIIEPKYAQPTNDK